MGFFKNLAAKRDAKRAQKRYEIDHAAWVRDSEILAKLRRAFEAVRDGVSLIEENMVNKPGEYVIWKGKAQYHEAARSPGTYQGRSSGVSVRIAKGVSYRVGGQQGTFSPGELEQRYEDVGMAYLTTHRLIFIGGGNTAEWSFDKWIGATSTDNPDDFMFNVSNRKKTSGLLFAKGLGREFEKFLALTIGFNESGIEKVLKTIEHYEKEIKEQEPKPPTLLATSERIEKPALPNGESQELEK